MIKIDKPILFATFSDNKESIIFDSCFSIINTSIELYSVFRERNIVNIKLLKYREQKNLTLAALSEMTGLGTGRLSEIETGVTSDPRISTLIKIADALDVTLDELVGRDGGWNLTQGICVAGVWMIDNHNESTMVVDMLASMHITKEMMQQKHVAEEDYKILSEAIDSNWERNGK